MKGQCAKGQGGLLSFSALACRRVLKISLCSLKKKTEKTTMPAIKSGEEILW